MKAAQEIVVIALGGNAIVQAGQEGTVPEQFANTRRTLDSIGGYLEKRCPLVITHGNGPQVGNIVIRVEESLNKAYEVPLGVCVAESQGEMGYMIAQTLQNKLRISDDPRQVVSLLTQSVVSRDDPQLIHPTKPIGPFYTKHEVRSLLERGLKVVEDSGRGYRRVVPSPHPIETVERRVISTLLDHDVIVIAAGGGGMPVRKDDRGLLEGMDAVVDKDLASSVLATEIGAWLLVIVTTVQHVLVDYATPDQRPLTRISPNSLQRLYDQGIFPAGSMGPKIEAVLQFLKGGGRRAIISSPAGISDFLAGKPDAVTLIEE